MKAIVVYESHWGNTAAVALAIAVGLGGGTLALSTTQAAGNASAGFDLIVAGAPLLGFSLPTDDMIKGLATNPGIGAKPPDLEHPSLRSWLATLPAGHGRCATFETRIWWSPGSAAKTIESALAKAGYPPIAKRQKFIVKGKYGPLREGELDRARQWGAELAKALG